MKPLQQIETVSNNLRRLVKRDSLTNLFLTGEQLSDGIQNNQLFYTEEADVFLLLRRGEPNKLYFVALTGSQPPVIPEFSFPLVCEVAKKDNNFTEVNTFLSSLGFHPILSRQRLLRRGGTLLNAAESSVRTAGTEDLTLARKILAACFDPLTGCLPEENALMRELAAGNILLHPDGGLLHFSVSGKSSELHHLAVLPEQRRKGIASALLAAYLNRLNEKSSRLWVAENNPAAQALYARFGYLPDRYFAVVYFYNNDPQK